MVGLLGSSFAGVMGAEIEMVVVNEEAWLSERSGLGDRVGESAKMEPEEGAVEIPGDGMSRAATVSALAEEPGREMGEDMADCRFVRTGFLRRPWKRTASATKLPTTPSQYPWIPSAISTTTGRSDLRGRCLPCQVPA